MRAHDEDGNRAFRKAPRCANADVREVWRGQRALSVAWRSLGEGEDLAQHRALAAWVTDAQQRLGGRVFRVRLEALEHLHRRILAFGHRAERIGAEPVRLIDTGERDADAHAFVVLSGHAPVPAGWALAAIVDHHDAHATVRAVSETGERLAPDRFAAATCEHCLLRRRRKTTYVVVHAQSGEVRQVGSACLRDFLGGQDPEVACRRAEHLALARAELERADMPVTAAPSADRPQPSIEEFAAHAAYALRAHGWISRERARRTESKVAIGLSTVAISLARLDPPRDMACQRRRSG